MLAKKSVLTALGLAAVAVSMGMAPAQSSEIKPVKQLAQSTPVDTAVLRSEAAAGAKVARPDPGAKAAGEALQGNIARWVEANGNKYTFASYVDDTTGRLVLKTNAPGAVVNSLVGGASATASAARAGLVEVTSTATTDLYSRKADVPAFWGGAGITASTGTPWCSSGFTVQNSAGTRSQVTAGHCFDNGTTVRTELGGAFVGTVSGRGLPSNDMERISGSSYWGYIYTGGTDSSTGQHVVGAGDAVVGYSNYCHSGRTTGENCGHKAISNFAQVCTSSGCKYPVTAFQGGFLPQGGDSGSPFYVKDSSSVWIRGMVIAGDGTTSYAEKYSRIASFFGVSIATN